MTCLGLETQSLGLETWLDSWRSRIEIWLGLACLTWDLTWDLIAKTWDLLVTCKTMTLSHLWKNCYRGLPTKCRSWNAVSQASGMAAAWYTVRWVGIDMRSSSGTATYSAYPPPESRVMTRSPSLQLCLTPGPTLATVPAASRPRTSLSPGGAGYSPFLCQKQKQQL